MKWTNGVISQLEELPAGPCGTGSDDQAFAVAVSNDGTVIVGNSGERNEHARPVVWINGAVSHLDPLGPPCGTYFQGAFLYRPNDFDHYPYPVNDLSGDGRFAVGMARGVNPDTFDAVYWPIDTRIKHTLARLFPTDTRAAALCISRNGDRIGGYSGPNPGPGAYSRGVIWNRATGMVQDVASLLQSVGLGPQIQGWQLLAVTDMSADGKQIAGTGFNPQGRLEAWWADLTNPPPNDNCANAVVLTTNTSPYLLDTQTHTVSGTTRDASWDGSASCASTAHENTNIWYKFTAPVAGYLMLDLCDSSPGLLDEYMSVHPGCPGTSANQVRCITHCPHRRDCDWPCAEPPDLFIPAGQTRYIQIGGWADEGHDIVLSYRFLPLNDWCADAFSVGHNPSSTPGSTLNMTVDAGANCQGVNATAPGVWYTVLGTGTTMTASTCGEGGDADFDTQISVFCSGCGGMTCVAANDDSPECAGSTTLTPRSRGAPRSERCITSWFTATGPRPALLTWQFGIMVNRAPSPSTVTPPTKSVNRRSPLRAER